MEYAGTLIAIDDLLNIQYVQYTAKMEVIDGIIDHGTNVNIPHMPDNFKEKDQGRHTFQAMSGLDLVGYDTGREVFMGPYRTYFDPLTVERGEPTNSLGYGDNPCGSLCGELPLEANETREFLIIVGIGKAREEGQAAFNKYSTPGKAEAELEALKNHWHSLMAGLSAETPDQELNSTINTWGIYNSLITLNWSRAASLIYSEYRSDDSLWLFNAVPAYVKETGDLDFFRKEIPYADVRSDTLLKHLRRAIEFSTKRSGKHGLPFGLKADWNDCLKFGNDGESVFVALQLRLALKEYVEISQMLGESEEKNWAEQELQKLDSNLQQHAWDGS